MEPDGGSIRFTLQERLDKNNNLYFFANANVDASIDLSSTTFMIFMGDKNSKPVLVLHRTKQEILDRRNNPELRRPRYEGNVSFENDEDDSEVPSPTSDEDDEDENEIDSEEAKVAV